MSVGNDLIDQDHRYLLCLVNSVELALKHEDTEHLLSTYMGQLLEYTKFHFEREEGIQKKIQYPQSVGHHEAHRIIVDHLKAMKDDTDIYLESKADGGVIDIELEERVRNKMTELAREWIIDHILKEDKKMEYYLRKVPRNFT